MPVNIQIAQGNFSLGPESGFFYTLSQSLGLLLKVEADGTIADTYTVTNSLIRNPVKQLSYDGTFFWSIEDLPSDLGIVIKKWRLFPFKTFAFPSVTPSELRWQDELALIHAPNIRWASRAFSLEHYHLSVNTAAAKGDTSLALVDASKVSVGDVLYLGPSSFGGFVGNEESITVTSKLGNTVFFTKTGGLENSYTSADDVDFHKALWLFNDHDFGGGQNFAGSLLRFSLPSKTYILTDSGMQYSTVQAADFDETDLAFVRGDQIITIDITSPTFGLASSMESNLREADLATPITVYDIIADLSGNQFYKLQQKETTEDVGTGAFTTTDFSPLYNFQTITTLPIVNSVAIRCNQRLTYQLDTADTISLTAEVRDQFNLPVASQTVQFSSALNPNSDPGTPGTFSPTTAVTTVSGTASTTYTPSSTLDLILVDLQAKVA